MPTTEMNDSNQNTTFSPREHTHSAAASAPVRAADATLLAALGEARPCLWTNPLLAPQTPAAVRAGAKDISLADVHAAHARFERFAPLLQRLFPELADSGGAIESPVLPAAALAPSVGLPPGSGALWIKADHSLPVAGSIKARGGIHEVLEFAERLAVQHGLVTEDAGPDDYRRLAEPAARAVFSRYQVAVGSTGNLGLSIGVMASALGLRAVVHMSADAKPWKKDRLRARGVEVIEHEGDYQQAVAAGRAQAQQDPACHFVDDERSLSLLLGYSAAVLRLDAQLREHDIAPGAQRPLFVYLPCGVGGAPAGIAFGLKQLYGPHAHCFFAEPTQSPCFLVQMIGAEVNGAGGNPSVYDYGLSNRTEADGLAVPRASELAAAAMRELLSGVYTVADERLFRDLYLARRDAGIEIEPSAAAGFSGPAMLTGTEAGQAYLARHGLADAMGTATHLVWTTGGLFVPPEEYRRFLARGEALAGSSAGQ
ncbi:D-serine ammonia-lyase [Cupriavidus sp. UGS-1]|uniref:D-serine ammonia-lyase n=1 Tax=Cupriavidus sp. UGS-1 TaxID=2899826 RepID=UPI001E39716F|nr:D-serine ammonia-lyase [Cupriavidus sp. UGS-1]MCD9121539.1 D-serine ammonia-lyase [Cupriavidus sp. UGS-1]